MGTGCSSLMGEGYPVQFLSLSLKKVKDSEHRPSALCAEKIERYFDFIVNILKSVHTSKYSILLSEPYTIATPKHFGLFLPGNSVRAVALTLDLRAASFYNTREFFYYKSTIKLLLLLILIKGSYPIFKPFLPSWKPSSALWLL
jgi:hypothetical protein